MSNLRRLLIRAATLALFAVLIASFALFGVGDIFRSGGGGRVVVTAGDVTVTAGDFQRQLRQRVNRLRQRTDRSLDMQTLKKMGLIDRLVQETVTRAVLEAEAKRLGLAVGDEQVAERIRERRIFRTEGGEFSRERFQQVLQQGGLSEEAYVERIRAQLMRRAIGDAVGGGVRAPDAMARAVYRFTNDARVAAYVPIDPASFEVEQPDAGAARSYYDDNTDAFTAPATRELTVLHATAGDLTERVKITEDELRQVYETRKDSYQQPERREISQLVLDSEAEARAVMDALRQGRSFTSAAERVTGGTPVRMGTVKPGDLPDPLADAAFATSEGTVTEPVNTALGWHLAKVEAVKPARTRAFADVRDELRAELAEDKAADRLIRMANEMRDALAGGATLEEVAQRFGLETTTVGSVDRRGRDRAGKPVEDIPAKSRVLQLAFDTPVKQRSLLKETEAGGYVAVRVDGETASKPRPFEAVRDAAERRLVQQRRLKAARQAAEDIVGRVEDAASLQDVAEARGARVKTTKPLTRASTPRDDALLAALAQRLFEVDPDAPFSVEGGGRLAVATVRETRAATPAGNPDAVTELGDQLGQQLRNDVFRQFTNALRARHTVRVNQDAIDRIVGGAR